MSIAPPETNGRRPGATTCTRRSAASRSCSGLTIAFVDDAITTVLGPSGTGKSVLLKHLVGLLEPDQGEVRVFGQDICEITEKERYELRKRFGVLFQDGALFGSMNIYDNVAFPLRKHTDMPEDEIGSSSCSRMAEVGLEAAAAQVRRTRSPAACASAPASPGRWCSTPTIVLFDEPDSGLDPVRTSLLNDLILDMHAEHGGHLPARHPQHPDRRARSATTSA